MKRPGLRSATRWAVAVVSLGAGSVAAIAGSEEASANPPAPQKFPDPFVVAPKAAERPSAVRKHDGGCFVTYPSGGAAKVACPKELDLEPVGQEIDRDDATGKCRQVPTTSWSGGSTGEIPCPLVLLVVATPGVMPDPSATASTSASASALPPVPTGFDPPMGGLSPPGPATVTPKAKDPGRRKDDDAPKAAGCGSGCAVGARDSADVATNDRVLALAVGGAVAIAARRSRRRRAPRT